MPCWITSTPISAKTYSPPTETSSARAPCSGARRGACQQRQCQRRLAGRGGGARGPSAKQVGRLGRRHQRRAARGGGGCGSGSPSTHSRPPSLPAAPGASQRNRAPRQTPLSRHLAKVRCAAAPAAALPVLAAWAAWPSSVAHPLQWQRRHATSLPLHIHTQRRRFSPHPQATAAAPSPTTHSRRQTRCRADL